MRPPPQSRGAPVCDTAGQPSLGCGFAGGPEPSHGAPRALPSSQSRWPPASRLRFVTRWCDWQVDIAVEPRPNVAVKHCDLHRHVPLVVVVQPAGKPDIHVFLEKAPLHITGPVHDMIMEYGKSPSRVSFASQGLEKVGHGYLCILHVVFIIPGS